MAHENTKANEDPEFATLTLKGGECLEMRGRLEEWGFRLDEATGVWTTEVEREQVSHCLISLGELVPNARRAVDGVDVEGENA